MTNPDNHFAAVSMMKNEGPYIIEWVAWQRVIGFDDILVYSNDCDDGTDLILDRLEYLGALTHERNNVLKRGPQKSALKYARDHSVVQSAGWVFVCDIDEFLTIHQGGGTLSDLVACYPDADAVPVAWRMFSGTGHLDLPFGLTIETFTDAEPVERPETEKGRFVKTLFRRSDAVERMGTHGPIYSEDADPIWRSAALTTEPDSDPLRPVSSRVFEVAQVNHYAVRSVDAYMIKRDRGRVNHVGDQMGLEYWERWSLGGQDDRSAMRHTDALKAEMARLRSDPILAHLEEGAKEWHRQKLRSLLEHEDQQQTRSKLMEMAGVSDQARSAAQPSPLAIRSPGRHQNRLRMLGEMKKNGRCAEIGVWDGAFSAAILEVTEPAELVLIDPWDQLSDQSPEDWTHQKHKNHEFMGGLRRNVETRLGNLPNVQIRQGFSAEVLETFEDGYFDWVYIDGNHLYEFVRKDLEVARRKVRKGGVIAGDDFFWKRDGRMHVREAVLDSLREWGGQQRRPSRFGQQYMITVE